MFIHKTLVVKNRMTTGEIRDKFTMAQVYTNGNHSLFLHEQLTQLHTANTWRKLSNIASAEDIMQNDYMFVILFNLNVISHLIFLQCFL